MEMDSVRGTLRLARSAYRTGGTAGLLAATVERGLSRPRVHPKLHWRLARAYYRRRCANDVAAYDAAPDPFKLERVSPDRIRRHTRREYPPYRDRLALFGAVRGGDWDRRDGPPVDSGYRGPPAELFLADRFEGSVLYRSLEGRFERGVPWEETPLVREVLDLVEESGPDRVWHECETAADVRRRCERLDALYASIRDDGYRSQRARFGTDPSVGFRHCLRHEIAVDVGRDGELLLVCGKHRLAIAKLLGLDAVPVVFLVRHPEWMRRRGDAIGGGVAEPHPDLRDIGP
ncbi:hypothetical protein [Halovivax sp.]|uniref:hypothetical protein n=1 Tax=Halovivax sp. TaxID=1935978 RepID=UPI0025C255EE|nr:hypothetical protein [Halovivax sp.]